MKQIIIVGLLFVMFVVPANADRERRTTSEQQAEIAQKAVKKQIKKQKEDDDDQKKKKAKQEHDSDQDRDKDDNKSLAKRVYRLEQALGLR